MTQIPLHIQAFIEANLHRDLAELALEAKKHPEIPINFVLDQIYGKRKAKEKLPNWAEYPQLIFPPKLSMEQCSSEQTAQFKASLVSGKLLIDLTGGFGVDDAFFAQSVEKLIYLEQQEELAEIVAHNFQQLGIANASFLSQNSIGFLQSFEGKADWIYLDPARRDENKKKVVGFEDCEPNLLEHLDLLLQKSENIMVKASPMLDIQLAIKQLKYVSNIWVVSVQNECKELLFQLTQQQGANPEIHCIDLEKGGGVVQFSGNKEAETVASISLSAPKSYLYEPNSTIMKAGLFKSLGQTFGLEKLHAHSHLFTSQILIEDFPGRAFICQEVLKFNKKELLKYLPQKKANITVRNFPLTVAEIRKKTGIQDGGDIYLFATTDMDGNKVCLLCQKA